MSDFDAAMMYPEGEAASPCLTADEAAAKIMAIWLRHGDPRAARHAAPSGVRAAELRRRREELEEKLRLEREGITFPAPSRISLRPSKDLSKVGPREAIEASHRRFNVPLRFGITCNPAPAVKPAPERVATAGASADTPVKKERKTVKTAKTPKTAKSAMDAMIKQEIAEAKFSALEGEVSGLRLALDSVMTASATLAKCRAGIAPGACKNAPDVITAASDLDQRLRELIASASAARNTCLNTIRRNSNE